MLVISESGFTEKFNEILVKYNLELELEEQRLEFFDLTTFRYYKPLNCVVRGDSLAKLNHINIFITFHEGFHVQAYIDADTAIHRGGFLERGVKLLHFYERFLEIDNLLNEFDTYLANVLVPFLRNHNINF